VITDRPPQSPKARREFERSDALTRLVPLPDAHDLQARATLLEKALTLGDARSVKTEGESMLDLLAGTYGISRARLQVLGARPRTVWEDGHSELFGDYDFEKKRIWIRMGRAWRIDWSKLRSSRSGN